jgi:adenosylcobinamide-GDP ribazoletransferase
MKGFFSALRFMTILPVPGKAGHGVERNSPYFFPLVGLVLGGILAGVDQLLIRVLPVMPASACLVLLLAVLTGGLHLDGLADSADGLFSGRPAERALAIMRDSRTGPMGVAALTLVLILKVTLLASVTGPVRTGLLVLMPLAGRSGIITVMAVLRYLRPQGLAADFGANKGLAVLAFVGLAVAGWLLLGVAGVAAGLLSGAVALLLAWYFQCRLGGYTGDLLGATCEIVELVPILFLAAWTFSHRGGA